MVFLIVIILIALILGLISRNRDDNFLDTLGRGFNIGCALIFWIIIITIAILYYS